MRQIENDEAKENIIGREVVNLMMMMMMMMMTMMMIMMMIMTMMMMMVMMMMMMIMMMMMSWCWLCQYDRLIPADDLSPHHYFSPALYMYSVL